MESKGISSEEMVDSQHRLLIEVMFMAMEAGQDKIASHIRAGLADVGYEMFTVASVPQPTA